MPTQFFQGGLPLSASALNRLAAVAEGAHLGASGYLARENGREQVVRNPRRDVPRAVAASSGACQWRVAAKWDADKGKAAVAVGPGLVAWGGGSYAVFEGAQVGSVTAGESRLVLWTTDHAPRPLKFDPRWPSGVGAPSCSGEGCNCHEATGDPNADWEASAGSVVLVEEREPLEGVTDIWLLAVVTVSATGAVRVEQWQRDTIAARAIVGAEPPPPQAGEDSDEEPPPCGNPLNGGGSGVDENPLDAPESHGSGGISGESDGDPTPEERKNSDGRGGRATRTDTNPLDSTGDGGYSPTCKDDPTQDL